MVRKVVHVPVSDACRSFVASLHTPQNPVSLTVMQISVTGFAIQCRITTEDPARNFAPDSGILSVYRTATGQGM